jgi:vacuolar-type H+-ATPase subunit D/Vma8
MDKEQFTKYAGETSDEFIKRMNEIVVELTTAYETKTRLELSPADAKRVYIYINALEQSVTLSENEDA